MKRKSMIIVIITIATLGTGAFAATRIGSGGDDDAAEATGEPDDVSLGELKPVNVETETVEASRLVEYVTARGVTEAETDVTFSAEIPGRISQLGPEVGETVKKGQVLARINLSSLYAQKKQAKASYELAKVTHGRLSGLGADIVTSQKLDEAKYKKSGARASLAAINADLSKGVVRSTVSGVVTAKDVERSEFVGAGTPLYRIVDHRTIVVEAQLAETQVAQVRVGSSVEVGVDALEQQFEGAVAAILPAADPVSKTFTVRVEVSNPDLAILVGMSAELRIASRVHEGVTLVVQDAVLEGRDGRGVYVAKDGLAEYRPVTLGAVDGDRVAVSDGLEPGDELIVLGQRYLTDGQPINITN
jgi:membrane fusion protein (multidrug efflux system)